MRIPREPGPYPAPTYKARTGLCPQPCSEAFLALVYENYGLSAIKSVYMVAIIIVNTYTALTMCLVLRDLPIY